VKWLESKPKSAFDHLPASLRTPNKQLATLTVAVDEPSTGMPWAASEFATQRLPSRSQDQKVLTTLLCAPLNGMATFSMQASAAQHSADAPTRTPEVL
jgi:hypothetical protein